MTFKAAKRHAKKHAKRRKTMALVLQSRKIYKHFTHCGVEDYDSYKKSFFPVAAIDQWGHTANDIKLEGMDL